MRQRAPISSLFAAEFRRDTIALWFSFCSCLLAVYLGFSWLPTVLAGAGFDPGVASSGITAFNLGGVVGALASGAVMSRVGSRAAMLTMNCRRHRRRAHAQPDDDLDRGAARAHHDHADDHRRPHQRDPDDDVRAGDERVPERRARERRGRGDGRRSNRRDYQRLCGAVGTGVPRQRFILRADRRRDGRVLPGVGHREETRGQVRRAARRITHGGRDESSEAAICRLSVNRCVARRAGQRRFRSSAGSSGGRGGAQARR